MTASSDSIPLHLHTLKTLCDELVSGRPVLLDNDGDEFRFSSKDTRSIFDWYRNNPTKWAANVRKTDVELIVDQLEKEPPELPLTTGISQNQENVFFTYTQSVHTIFLEFIGMAHPMHLLMISILSLRNHLH